jgi:hypothetical protein
MTRQNISEWLCDSIIDRKELRELGIARNASGRTMIHPNLVQRHLGRNINFSKEELNEMARVWSTSRLRARSS